VARRRCTATCTGPSWRAFGRASVIVRAFVPYFPFYIGFRPQVYRVGSQYGWSPVYSFVGLQERPDGGYKFAVFGDMGNVNARSLGKLQREAQDGDFDMVLHVGSSIRVEKKLLKKSMSFTGDMAYNLDTVS
jgi:hypothetical protein